MLNLKRIRLKRMMEMDGEVRAHLYARGEGSGERVVTAGDVAWPAEVEVINPDQPIATLDIRRRASSTWTSGSAATAATARPRPRRSSARRHPDRRDLHADRSGSTSSSSTPASGQMTDFDRLILEILTDGTIEPDDALAQAAQILVDHAKIFADFNRKDGDVVGAAARSSRRSPEPSRWPNSVCRRGCSMPSAAGRSTRSVKS